jgi:hypothetical protein
MHPFSVVSGDSFLEIAQALINVGVSYRQVKAADVIPHRTTLSKHVGEHTAALKREVVIPELKHYVNKWGGGITSNMWTKGYTQTPYIRSRNMSRDPNMLHDVNINGVWATTGGQNHERFLLDDNGIDAEQCCFFHLCQSTF